MDGMDGWMNEARNGFFISVNDNKYQ